MIKERREFRVFLAGIPRKEDSPRYEHSEIEEDEHICEDAVSRGVTQSGEPKIQEAKERRHDDNERHVEPCEPRSVPPAPVTPHQPLDADDAKEKRPDKDLHPDAVERVFFAISAL